MTKSQRWIPAGILVCACLVDRGLVAHRSTSMPLRAPITSVAPTLLGVTGVDEPIDSSVQRVAGMDTFINRNYPLPDSVSMNVYVGYYDEQHEGKTIHSPKNCLPAQGWEPSQRGTVIVPSDSGPVTVNRYLVVLGSASSVVYYWYQGRGRVAHDEMRVTWDLFRDAVVLGRTEESLVRIVVPVRGGDVAAADSIAGKVAPRLVDDVYRILPTL
jgi:EpsI family protein